jgi:hypothetical protein
LDFYLKKKTDDIRKNRLKMEIISIGFYCLTTHYIRSMSGDRSESYPFDWLFTSIDMIRHCIDTKFLFFLDKQYYISDGAGMYHKYYQSFIDNRMIHKHNEGFLPPGQLPRIFNHHNLTQDHVYDSFKRRCERFLNVISNPLVKVKLIYSMKFYSEEENEFEDINVFSDYMQKAYPHVEIYCFKFMESREKKDPCLVMKRENLEMYNIYQYTTPKGPLDLSVESEASVKKIVYRH